MDPRILDKVRYCHGQTQISNEIAQKIGKIYTEDERRKVTGVNNDACLKRMDIVPFKVSAQIGINKPVILTCTIPQVNVFGLTASQLSPSGFPHTGSEWQVSMSMDFTNPVKTVDSPTELESVLMSMVSTLPATSYYFRVRYRSNLLISDWSDVLVVVTAALDPITKPSILTCSKTNDTTFSLTGSAFNHPVLSHTGSTWQVSRFPDFNPTLDVVTGGTHLLSAAHVLAEILPLTDYYFRVKYLSGSYESPWSDTVKLTTEGGITISKPSVILDAPLCPYNFAIAGSSFNASNPAAVHDGTVWQVSTSPTFDTLTTSILTGTDLTSVLLSDGVCNEGTEYYVRVMYKSGTVESPWSDAVSATTGYVVTVRPKRANLAALDVSFGDYPNCLPVSIGDKLYGTYINKSGNLEVMLYNSTDDVWENFSTKSGVLTADFKIVSGVGELFVIERDTALVVSKLNLTTKVWTTLANNNHNIYTSSPRLCGYVFHDGYIYSMGPNSQFLRLNVTTSTWSSLPYDVMLSITTEQSFLVCSTETGFYATLGEFGNGFYFYNYTNQTWTAKNNTFQIVGVFENGISLLRLPSSIIMVVETYVPSTETYTYSLREYDMTLDIWEVLENIPGVSDFDYPFFTTLGEDLYVISLMFGVIFQPKIYQDTIEYYLEEKGSFPASYGVKSTFLYNGLLGFIVDTMVDRPNVIEVWLINKDTGVKEIIPMVYTMPDNYPINNQCLLYYNGAVYSYGGFTNNGGGTIVGHLYKLDLTTKITTLESDTGLPAQLSSGVGLTNKLCFIGGALGDGTYQRPRYYDLLTQTWTTLSFEAEVMKRTSPTMFVFGTSIIVTQGTSNVLTPTDLDNYCWKWSPETEAIDSFPASPATNPMFFPFGGKLYVTSKDGCDGTGNLVFYEYLPGDNQYTLAKEVPSVEGDTMFILPIAGYEISGELFLVNRFYIPNQSPVEGDKGGFACIKVNFTNLTYLDILFNKYGWEFYFEAYYPEGTGAIKQFDTELKIVCGAFSDIVGLTDLTDMTQTVRTSFATKDDLREDYDTANPFNLFIRYSSVGFFTSPWSEAGTYTYVPPIDPPKP